MSMIGDIRQYLMSTGVTIPMILSHMPDEGECVALYQYAGKGQMILAGLEQPGLQVKARYSDYETAMDAVAQIANIIVQIGDEYSDMDGSETINGKIYHRVLPVASAFSLGWNENEQVEIVQNFYVTKGI